MRTPKLLVTLIVVGMAMTGCAAQTADPSTDVPALDRAPIVDLLPAHSAIDRALGRDLPYTQEPREIVLTSDSNQPSDGTVCDLSEYTSGHPNASLAGQVIVGAPKETVGIEVFRFSDLGSATKYMKTVSTLQDECALQKKSGITSWSTRESDFTAWQEGGQPHSAFQWGAIVGYVFATAEEDAAKITKLLSDTMADFK